MTPEDVLARWPAEEPLAVLYSGQGPMEQARWTVVARPAETVRVRAGEDWERASAFLRREVRGTARAPTGAGEGPMFKGGWIGWISYDLGREIEPRAQVRRGGAARDRDWAIMEWRRCDEALVHDRVTGAWWVVGEGWERVWRGVTQPAQRDTPSVTLAKPCVTPPPLGAGEEQRPRYLAACERVLEYIRAGDVYQVNLAHRLSHRFEGSARGMFRGLVASASPWFGAYVESTEGATRRAVCSVSPELLFRIEGGTGRIVTRPMKGTRAPGVGAERALHESEKDRAELNMIVDLMRNDLGRVCEVGSVRVERGREVEQHGQRAEGRGQRADESSGQWRVNAGQEGDRIADNRARADVAGGGILQATATVVGVVRVGVTLADVIRAIVPGGSVTGAPKIRAMQIIDELEAVRRGPYCGAVGFVGDDGTCAMNVGIRTALISGSADAASRACDAIVDGVMDYSVGAGIVADSVAELEWMETLEKAGVLNTALHRPV